MASPNNTTYSIYRIVCFATGGVYVGRTINQRVRQSTHFRELAKGKHHSAKLQYAFNKYGRDSFYFEVLESGLTSENVAEREHWWINEFQCFTKGYNMTEGGETYSQFGEQCEWNGIIYPSITEAARSIGIGQPSMLERVRKGYKSDADLKRDTSEIKAKPCVLFGISYPSLSAAARAHGKTLTTVRRWIELGCQSPEDLPLGRRKPIEWEGVKYRSLSAAAKANGINHESMRHRIEKGHTNNDDVESARHKTPCTWNGVFYASIAEAARAIGITQAAMQDRLSKGYTCEGDMPHGSYKPRKH